MSQSFAEDLDQVLAALALSRAELDQRVGALSDQQLQIARRGGWTVGRILEHIVNSELLYAAGVSQLRGVERASTGNQPDNTAADMMLALAESRLLLLSAVEGVDEECFYRLGHLGHEEYSVLSILENAMQHDLEHAHQIEMTMASSPSDPSTHAAS